MPNPRGPHPGGPTQHDPAPRGPEPPPPGEWARVALAEHESWLRTAVGSRLREPSAVDDVMQQVALAASQSADALRDPSSAGAWLYRVALVAVLQHRRAAGRRRKLMQRFTERRRPVELDEQQPDPLAWLLAEEQRALVRGALARLPPRDAEALVLKHTQDWTYAELARRLGVSESAVVGRLHRARARLRAALAEAVAPPHRRESSETSRV